MKVSGQLHATATLSPGKETPGTHWTGVWVGSRDGLDAVAKRKIPNPFQKLNTDSPARSLVATLNELSRLLYEQSSKCKCWNKTGCRSFQCTLQNPSESGCRNPS